MFISSIMAAINRLLTIQSVDWWVVQNRKGWHVAIDHIDQGIVFVAGPFLTRPEAIAYGQVMYGEEHHIVGPLPSGGK